MLHTMVSILTLVSLIQINFCVNAVSTPITSYSPNPLMTSSLNRMYSLTANTDIGSLLMSGSKSGTQPTIVAIPLYIRNNLSKYPSIYELLSSGSFQQNERKISKIVQAQPNDLDATNFLKKLVNENTKQDDFASTQRYQTQTQKSMKYNIREEQQKVVRQRDQHKYDTELRDSVDFSSPQKSQWSSSLINTPNRYSQSNEKTYSRPQQRFPIEENRKQSPPEYETAFNTFPTNKFNDLQNNELKVSDTSDYGSVDAIKTNFETHNRYNVQNYSPVSASSDGKVAQRNRGSDKSTYNSPQSSSHNSEMSEENPNLRYSDSGNRDDNYYSKNEDKYQNQDDSDYEMANKNNAFQYRSPPIHISSNERSIQSNQYTTPTNTYTSRPISLRQTYENPFVTSKPLISSSLSPVSSDEESSQSIPSNYYNNNFQPMIPSNAYNYQSNPSNFGADPQINGNPSAYSIETQSVSPNNNYLKTESKYQFTSISNPNYSSDYSTSEDVDCYDDNSNDYKSTHSSQSSKSQNIRPEIDTKNNDSYESEDFDPSKLDLKIVHLPVSLLRRLIGSGDIGLPSYQ